MRLPSRATSTPESSPAGTLMFRRVPPGSGTSSISSTIRAVNAAAPAKSNWRPRRKSISPAVDCWETATAGSPRITPSSAAATVPEYVMSSPRLAPWVMPETISSAWNPSTSPSAANRTQSTGVPSVAKPTVPSPNGTSSTHSGRRVVMPRPIAERLPSGAITASSMPGTSSSARRRACRPSAAIPSSLVSSTRTPGRILGGGPGPGVASVGRRSPPSVADRGEVEAVGRRGGPGLRAGAPREQPLEVADGTAAAGHLQHGPDEHAVHVAHERVRLDPEDEQLTLALPARRDDVAAEALVVRVRGREGREVVRADERAGAGLQRRQVGVVGPPQRPRPLERRGRRPGEHAVEVGAGERVVARGEAVRRGLRREDGDLVWQQGVDGAQGRGRPGIGDDLAERVDPAVRAAGHREVDRRAQDGLQRPLELGRHGAPAGLRGPAGEGRPVVLERQLADQGAPPSLRGGVRADPPIVVDDSARIGGSRLGRTRLPPSARGGVSRIRLPPRSARPARGTRARSRRRDAGRA